MKVFIITKGGENIGFGHITRCIALYQAFEEKGAKPEFIVNGDKNIKYLLGDKNYRILNWLEEERRLFGLVKNSSVAIIDSYLASASLYENLSNLVEIPVYIDDTKRLNYPRGIVVNGNIYAEILNYPKNDEVIYLLGTEYTPLRKEFWNIPGKFINNGIKNILITFGGMDHSDLMHKIIDSLKKRFDFTFDYIDARENRLTAKDMLGLMLKADICISGGGQTIYELARVGTPTIGICFAENQRLNLDGWERAGFIGYTGWHNDSSLLEKTVEATHKFIPYEERVRRSKIGRKYKDGRGAKNIVNKILEAIR